MKTIVIDARESGTSTGRYIDKLVEYIHLLKPGYKFILLAKKDRITPLNRLAPDFEVVECPHPEFSFAEQTKLKTQIKSLKPDLVHFGMVQQPIFYRGRVVTTMHDLTTTRFRNPLTNPVVLWVKLQVYKWVNKRAAKKSVAIITPTRYVKKDVADYTGVRLDKITVTHEAADKIVDTPVVVSGLENQQFIMYIGRPMPHKNLGRLIEAFKIIQQTHPNLKLVLAGQKDALYQRIEQTVKDNGINNVLFTGFISEGQLRWLYEHTAAYIFPSLSEGFGLPGLEAMVHGSPVVSSDATCLPEVYGDAALYFDPLSIDDMADKITSVLDNPRMADDLRAKGTKQAAKFSWHRMASQTLEIYRKALG